MSCNNLRREIVPYIAAVKASAKVMAVPELISWTLLYESLTDSTHLDSTSS